MFNKNEHSQVPLPNRSAPFMNDIVVSAVGVTKLLKGLNPSKALGPDELHPRVLIPNYRHHSDGNCRKLPVSVKRCELTYLSNNLHGDNRGKH